MRPFFCLLAIAAFSVVSGGEPIPWTNAGWCWTCEGPRLPSVDRNLYGGEITIGGERFCRGIAGHTPFTVFFLTGGFADSLSGFIGIEDRDHPRDPSGELDTMVDAVILADRREVYRRTVRLGERAIPFRLDLKGVHHLELRGEYKKHFFKQRIVFADLQFESEDPAKLRAFALEKKKELAEIKRRKVVYPCAPDWKRISIRKEKNEYVIENGKIRLRLLPEIGGRIYGLSLKDGENFLLPNSSFQPDGLLERGRNRDFGGGHFMRPEPRNYFLPSEPVLKYAPYSIEFPAEGRIVMTSPPSFDFLLRYSYHIEIKEGESEFLLCSRMVNLAPFPQNFGIWSITRLDNKKIRAVVFPDGDRVRYSAAFPARGEKGFNKIMRTEYAVLAVELNGGGIFQKQFRESGGRLHLFVNERFSELEFHGPVRRTESGESLELNEKWSVGKRE